MSTAKTYQNIEELAADLQFILWVRSESAEPDGQWYEDLELQGSLEWIEPAADLVRKIHFKRSTADQETIEQIWRSIDIQISEGSGTTTVRTLPSTRWRVAAGVAIIVAFFAWWLMAPQSAQVETGFAETTTTELPDGSEVILNAGSSLSYDAKHWSSERLVDLDGEAFFKVVKGEKFSVRTNGSLIEVLGTSFNVKSRKNTFSVSCHTGKVRVSHDDQDVILERGIMVELQKGQLVTSTFQVDPEKTWMAGYFLFSDAPLRDVIMEIERQFDVSVSLKDVDGTRTYSGFFVKNNLTEALQAVCWPLRLDFEVNGTHVTISQDNK